MANKPELSSKVTPNSERRLKDIIQLYAQEEWKMGEKLMSLSHKLEPLPKSWQAKNE